MSDTVLEKFIKALAYGVLIIGVFMMIASMVLGRLSIDGEVHTEGHNYSLDIASVRLLNVSVIGGGTKNVTVCSVDGSCVSTLFTDSTGGTYDDSWINGTFWNRNQSYNSSQVDLLIANISSIAGINGTRINVTGIVPNATYPFNPAVSGDLVIFSVTSILYQYNGSVMVPVANLSGHDGVSGSNGSQGIAGVNGSSGVSISSATVLSNGSLNISLSNGTIFISGNLSGQQGVPGVNGSNASISSGDRYIIVSSGVISSNITAYDLLYKFTAGSGLYLSGLVFNVNNSIVVTNNTAQWNISINASNILNPSWISSESDPKVNVGNISALGFITSYIDTNSNGTLKTINNTDGYVNVTNGTSVIVNVNLSKFDVRYLQSYNESDPLYLVDNSSIVHKNSSNDILSARINCANITGATSNLCTVTGGGAGTPGGNDTQLQFNDNGSFNGSLQHTFNKSSGQFYFSGGYYLNINTTFYNETYNPSNASITLGYDDVEIYGYPNDGYTQKRAVYSYLDTPNGTIYSYLNSTSNTVVDNGGSDGSYYVELTVDVPSGATGIAVLCYDTYNGFDYDGGYIAQTGSGHIIIQDDNGWNFYNCQDGASSITPNSVYNSVITELQNKSGIIQGDLEITKGGLLIDGTMGDNQINGSGTRLEFIPSKGATRGGVAVGNEWNDTNIGLYSTAWGYNVRASGTYAVALGGSSSATNTNSFSASGGSSSGASATAVSGGSASGSYSLASGSSCQARGVSSTALGNVCIADGDYSVCMGTNNQVYGNGATGIGSNIFINGTNSFAQGNFVNIYSANCIALGYGTTACKNSVQNYGVAIGGYANTTNYGGISLGYQSKSLSDYAIAEGYQCVANGSNSVCIGSQGVSSGTSSVTIGSNSLASGDYSFSIMNGDAKGQFSLSVGQNTQTLATSSMVIGSGANSGSKLINNISNSLMIGFTSATAWLFLNTTLFNISVINANFRNTNVTSLNVTQSFNSFADVNISKTGKTLSIDNSTNGCIGKGTLVSGKTTISTTCILSTSFIFLTSTNIGSVTNIGTLEAGQITSGSNFNVTSSNVLDTSTFNWMIIQRS